MSGGVWDRRSSRRWGSLTAAVLGTLLACAPHAAPTTPSVTPVVSNTLATDRAFVFAHVTVVDVTDGTLHSDQTVVVAGTRVRAVDASADLRAPAGARVIDARGKYLIPGLWEMHAHVDNDAGDGTAADSVYRLIYARFVAHGITGVREMAQRFPGGADSFRVWQREILAGQRVGPRGIGPSVDIYGPQSFSRMFGGIDDGPGQVRVRSVAEMRQAVDSLRAAGMAFLKMHDDLISLISLDLYFALLREARRVGLPVVGHLPDFWTPTAAAPGGGPGSGPITPGPSEQMDVAAADSGQRSIEHIDQLHCWAGPRPPAERCALAAAAFQRNRTWLVPTLMLFADSSHAATLADMQQLVRVLRGRGVTTWLAGTDLGYTPTGEAGASLLQELQLLVGAGLTPLEALQAATLNPAEFFQLTDSLGTVAPGKLADLVLLDANPLEDIGNTRQIRAVVANGRYFDRAALDRLLADAARSPRP